MDKPISSTLTSNEVCQKYGISKYTILNWRRGHYFVGSEFRVWYFEDHSGLPTEWNEDYRRLEYNPIKVAVWVNRLNRKKAEVQQKRVEKRKVGGRNA